MRRLVLASTNKGKIREMTAILAGLPFEVVGLEAYPGAPSVEENGRTFAENAVLKAKAYAAFTNELTLADDSGLEVDALDGEPGVKSARYGESGWTDRQRYEYLVSKLQNVPAERRSARFHSVVAVYDPAVDKLLQGDGTVEGVIIDKPRGNNGFGYDPVFFLPEYGQTMAELSSEVKNDLSHRGRALAKLLPLLSQFAD